MNLDFIVNVIIVIIIILINYFASNTFSIILDLSNTKFSEGTDTVPEYLPFKKYFSQLVAETVQAHIYDMNLNTHFQIPLLKVKHLNSKQTDSSIFSEMMNHLGFGNNSSKNEKILIPGFLRKATENRLSRLMDTVKILL